MERASTWDEYLKNLENDSLQGFCATRGTHEFIWMTWPESAPMWSHMQHRVCTAVYRPMWGAIVSVSRRENGPLVIQVLFPGDTIEVQPGTPYALLGCAGALCLCVRSDILVPTSEDDESDDHTPDEAFLEELDKFDSQARELLALALTKGDVRM